MYAVIKTGGKQHKVQAGDVIEVERLVSEGETVTFQPLLVVDDDGTTHAGAGAAKAVVTASPLGEKKGDKIRIFKYRPKSGYARRQGHRQVLTMLEITGVSLEGSTSGSARSATKRSASDGGDEKAATDGATSDAPAAKTTTAKKTTAKKPPAKKTTAKKTTATKTSATKAGATTPDAAE